MPDSNVTVVEHPVILTKLTELRDFATESRKFRALLNEIASLMVYEVTRHWPTKPKLIQTPLEKMTGHALARPITLVPILRAGLGMTDGVLHLLPDARLGHLGVRRDEETLQPIAYYQKLPPDIAETEVLLIDPMLATGGSLGAAIEFLFKRGAQDVTAICLLGAPEGVAAIERQVGDRDVTLVLGALDERLNDKGYIVPGLGDAGDRLYGTV